MPATDSPAFAQALSRIPSGLFIVSTLDGERPLGFLGSFVQQVGFAPPSVCVAVGKDRDHLAAMRASGAFTVSVIDGESEKLMGRFFKKYAPGEGPFDGLEVELAPSGAPYLSGALAWLDCKVSGEHTTGDHVVVFGTVADGAQLRPGDPSIHLRKNGLGY